MKGEKKFIPSDGDLEFRTEAVIIIQYNWSLLHLAVWFNNSSVVDELLSSNYDANLIDVVSIN